MSVRVSDIALFLSCSVPEDDFVVDSVCSLFEPKSRCLTFSTSREAQVDFPDELSNLLVLAPEGFDAPSTVTILRVENPRLAYATTVSHFFSTTLFGNQSISHYSSWS